MRAAPGQPIPRSFVGDFSILLVATIWGSSYLAMQIVGATISPPAFLALRFACALPLVAFAARKSIASISSNEMKVGAVFGFLLFAILFLETTGVKYTSAANAGFLITLSVLLVPAFERVICRVIQPRLVYAAAALGCMGCAMLSLSNGFSPRSGDLIIIAAALIRALHITLLGRRSHVMSSTLNVTFIQLSVVLLLSTVIAFATGHSPFNAATVAGMQSWLLIAYLGAFGTAFAFFAQLSAARLSSATRVGIILSTEPVFAALFAVTLGGEHLTSHQIVGGAVVIVSVCLGRLVEARRETPIES